MALYGGLSVVAMLGIGLLVVLGGAVAIGFSSYLNIASAIPANVQAVAPDRVGDQPTLLLDREARRVIYRISPLPGSTPWVTLETLPPYVWQAALAMEDADFLARPEFSPAALVDALARSVTNGQVGLDDPLLLYLARHVLVPLSELPSDDPNRNFTDTILILELRRRFSREELLGGTSTRPCTATARMASKPPPSCTLARARLTSPWRRRPRWPGFRPRRRSIPSISRMRPISASRWCSTRWRPTACWSQPMPMPPACGST